MSGKKRTLVDLAKLSANELEAIFENGIKPDAEKLIGWDFKGYNVPLIAKLIGVKKFKKGFYRKSDQLWGYNVTIHQDSIEKPWRSKRGEDNPKRYGFHRIKEFNPDSKENKEPESIIFDYGEGKNHLWEGSFLRDYVKQVDPDNEDLYIGKAYIALGDSRVLPNFFILERDKKAPERLD